MYVGSWCYVGEKISWEKRMITFDKQRFKEWLGRGELVAVRGWLK